MLQTQDRPQTAPNSKAVQVRVTSSELLASTTSTPAIAQTKKCSSSYYSLSFLIPATVVTAMFAIDCNNCMGISVLAGTLAGGCGYTLYKLAKIVRHSGFSRHSHSS